MGFAKHALDLTLSRIFERWFLVFVESNMASLLPVSFLYSGNLGRGQRFNVVLLLFLVLAFVSKFPALYTDAEFSSSESFSSLRGYYSCQLHHNSLFWFQTVQEVSF